MIKIPQYIIFVALVTLIITITLLFQWTSFNYKLVNGNKLLRGSIKSLVIVNHHRQRFDFQTVQGRFLISWYGYHHNLNPGQSWQLMLRLKKTAQLSLGYYHFLIAKGFHGVGYVKASPYNHYLGFNFWNAPVSIGRSWVKKKLLLLGHNLPMLAIIIALAIGDRNLFTPQIWQVF